MVVNDDDDDDDSVFIVEDVPKRVARVNEKEMEVEDAARVNNDEEVSGRVYEKEVDVEDVPEYVEEEDSDFDIGDDCSEESSDDTYDESSDKSSDYSSDESGEESNEMEDPVAEGSQRKQKNSDGNTLSKYRGYNSINTQPRRSKHIARREACEESSEESEVDEEEEDTPVTGEPEFDIADLHDLPEVEDEEDSLVDNNSGRKKKKKQPVHFDPDAEVPNIALEVLFKDCEEVKAGVMKLSLLQGKKIIHTRNEKLRQNFRCSSED